MYRPDARIIVFAKAPVAGAVNTRLMPSLGAEGAAELQRRFVLRVLERVGDAVAPVELWCSPASSHPFFAECGRHFDVALRTQRGRDLGERMYRAMDQTLEKVRFAALIGADCPDLNHEDLEAAFRTLDQKADAVFLPTEDGGYGLIALRQVHPRLFRGVPWGSGEVMAVTRERLRELGWQWSELPVGWDVDRLEDLPRLPRGMLAGIPPEDPPVRAPQGGLPR